MSLADNLDYMEPEDDDNGIRCEMCLGTGLAPEGWDCEGCDGNGYLEI